MYDTHIKSAYIHKQYSKYRIQNIDNKSNKYITY